MGTWKILCQCFWTYLLLEKLLIFSVFCLLGWEKERPNLSYQREYVVIMKIYGLNKSWNSRGGREALPLSAHALSLLGFSVCVSVPLPPSLPMSSSYIQYLVYFLNLYVEFVARAPAELPGNLLMVTVSVFLDSKPQETLMQPVRLFDPGLVGHLFLVFCFCPFLVQLWPKRIRSRDICCKVCLSVDKVIFLK